MSIKIVRLAYVLIQIEQIQIRNFTNEEFRLYI